MKTIAFFNQENAFPIPAICGGAVEELEHILADENEKKETYKFIFFQPELTAEQKQKIDTYHFKHTQLAYLKKGKHNLFGRAIRKGFRLINIYLKTKYEKNFLRELNNYQVDKIVFEGYCPISTIRFLSKKYGKDNLYFHIHSNYQPNREIVKYVGHLIGVSDFVLTAWSKFYQKKHLTPITHDVLKNCVRSERFAKKNALVVRDELRENLSFHHDDFIVIYCGRTIPEKGVFELMQAVCAVKDQRIKLLVIGSTNFSRIEKSTYLDHIGKYIEEHRDRITYTGYVPNKNLAQYYQIADLHIVPSLWEEPAGLVVLEGQMCGVPQIITKAGGMIEYASNETIILDRNQELVNNLSQQIIALSQNPDQRKKMISSGLENSQKYTGKNYYKNFVDLIGKLNQ